MSADARRCPRCGYDVASVLGAGGETCPECGGAVDERACHPPVWCARLRRDLARLAALALGFGVVAGAGAHFIGVWASNDPSVAAFAMAGRLLVVMGGVPLLGWRVRTILSRVRGRTTDPDLLGAKLYAALLALFSAGVGLALGTLGAWAFAP